jgi:hypothetical protein
MLMLVNDVVMFMVVVGMIVDLIAVRMLVVVRGRVHVFVIHLAAFLSSGVVRRTVKGLLAPSVIT